MLKNLFVALLVDVILGIYKNGIAIVQIKTSIENTLEIPKIIISRNKLYISSTFSNKYLVETGKVQL